jgi:hypothetical protein
MFPIVILAGGLATRLRPITEKIPKSLIEINGEPFVIHQLKLLEKKGFKKYFSFLITFYTKWVDGGVFSGGCFIVLFFLGISVDTGLFFKFYLGW